MPNQTQINQERIYQELLALHRNSPINQGDEKFNFWIRPQATTNRTTKNREWYRFNRGNTGYSNIGIVKVGSRSALQIVGFHTTDFLSYFLNILNRDQDYPRIKKGTKLKLSDQDVDDFLKHLNTVFPRTRHTFTNDVDAAQWMYDMYQSFFKEVKNYDLTNKTPFYDILKITDNDFNKNHTTNDKNMASLFPPQQNGIGNPPPPPVKPQNSPLNQILYGPPGTGKTYNTLYYALSIIEGESIDDLKKEKYEDLKKRYYGYVKDERIFFTTFHQSMSYEDFIEGIKPEAKGGVVTYDVKPGIFKELCIKAEVNYKLPYVLIIDEINRGNVSQIFGELITLIEEDKRVDIELKNNGTENGLTVRLPYSPDKEFYVPSNIYIIGTMNTADRSVEALDTALRRRFKFVEMMPKPNLLNITVAGVSLSDLLETINKRIVVLKDREHQIGHSYFMSKGKPIDNSDDLKAAFKDKIVPLLQEYFYGNYNNIGLVLGKEFVVKENNTPKFAEDFQDDGISDQPLYKLLTEDKWKTLNLEDALKTLMNSKPNPIV